MTSLNTPPFVFSNTDDTFNTDTEEITSITTRSATLDFDGLKIDYDKTTIPKQFSITPNGVNWRDGTNNYLTGLERLALVQTAFQAVELPPNATTLKINDTLLVSAGVANQSTTIDDDKITINNASVGGTANPMLVLQNNNNTAGSVAIETYKNKVNGAQNDTIANWSMYAKDYTGAKTEFARINSTITNSSVGGGNDGAVNIWCAVNGAVQNVFTFNGADNENNSFRPLDLTGNNLKTSSGNMTIDATASTGTGTITLAPKTGAVVDIQSNATLTGTRQATFGGGTNITNTINQTGLTITNNTASPNTEQSIYQVSNCNLVQIDTPSNSQYFNTNTPTTQTIRRMDITSGSDLQKNQSTLVQTRLDYTDVATGDTSSIRLENDLASLNNVIGQTYTTGAGAVLETILQTTPYGSHRLLMSNNNTGFSTSLNTTQLYINDNGNNKSITLNNNPSSTECRVDLFKNDGGGIYAQSGIANNTGTQILFLNQVDNANNKSIALTNNRSSSTTLTFDNTIDANGFDIISNKSLNLISNDAGGTAVLQSANGVQITGDNTIAMNTNTGADTISFQTNNLTFTGASLQSNTSSGNSGEHLVITLNGNQYKIKLELV